MIELVSRKIESYCIQHSTLPSKYCQAIEIYTRRHVPYAQMLIGPLEASFLGILLRSIKAKRILEIGCFTGYSALAMAECLPARGRVVTLDIDPVTTRMAQRFWKRSPHGRKIKLILGDALKTLKHLKGTFDFVFIDADKINYLNYFKTVLPRLNQNGMIVLDNCLWSGRVLHRGACDQDTKALKQFNRHIARRRDLISMLAPIRDGVYLIKKRTR